jgi:Cytochrome b(N-terminal)/b6/petB
MLIQTISSLINLNQPQHYFHWSIFTISIANLIIILTMIIIFGLAIILPFPKDKIYPPEKDDHKTTKYPAGDNTMWTAKIRNFGLRILPPGKLIPDRQPAYVASWIYVFGVATLASLGLVILSGTILAIGGVNWWHQSSLGHYVNSVHLWGVELFMAFMVIHLWGKFWMAAWRGKRALTWMTGVIAFAASILECFTGYLSQQNFDSQWISTNGKDAINATGLGSFFNLMNFGQMLTWHIVIMPLILVLIVVIHILMVRVRGVSHPIVSAKDKEARRKRRLAEASDWKGPTKKYDIVKEGFIASLIVLILVVLLAGLLSSPDEPPVTVASWAKIAPADFMATAASELNGTSETAQYGPPYNNGNANLQKVGVSWQMLGGVHQAINPANTFVLQPLSSIAPSDQNLARSLAAYNSASPAQQMTWANNYAKVVTNVTFKNGTPYVPMADYGPVPVLVNSELSLAQSGAIDADLLAQQPFYGTDYSKPLLFIEDGNYFSSKAETEHLTGAQWGVMNETGSYPGQPWLWLYTLWYQIPSFSQSANVDLIAIYLTGVGTLLLLLVPLIPGLRDIPRVIPIHKLIWRGWGKAA